MNNIYSLTHGKNYIPYDEFHKIADAIKETYCFSNPVIWMWKAFQFGFEYGVHAERGRRKSTRGMLNEK